MLNKRDGGPPRKARGESSTFMFIQGREHRPRRRQTKSINSLKADNKDSPATNATRNCHLLGTREWNGWPSSSMRSHQCLGGHRRRDAVDDVQSPHVKQLHPLTGPPLARDHTTLFGRSSGPSGHLYKGTDLVVVESGFKECTTRPQTPNTSKDDNLNG